MLQPPINLRVLVADAYTDAADSLALLLDHWGHDVRVAYSGPEALASARHFRPHIVVTELKLDGLDGFQLADQLRQQAPQGLTLLALTGLSDDRLRRRARACGFHSFLLKPVDPERIRKLLAGLGDCTFAGMKAPRRRSSYDQQTLLRGAPELARTTRWRRERLWAN
jgi:CheY-like chemotaxis protein